MDDGRGCVSESRSPKTWSREILPSNGDRRIKTGAYAFGLYIVLHNLNVPGYLGVISSHREPSTAIL